jgi:transmembrane sensor
MRNSDEDTISEEAQHWVVRLASGDMAAGELAAFETCLARSDTHARAFADERTFWRRLSPLGATFDRLDRDAKAGRSRRRHAGIAALAIAACLLAYISGLSFVTWVQADYVSGFERVVFVSLPDGSRATLNRDSAIRVDFDAAARNVTLLRGQVYVDVEPDAGRPFRVAAGQGVSEAVGTAYAVSRMGGRTQVAVTEGRVAVTGAAEPGVSVSLAAGEGVAYADGRFLGAKFAVNGDATSPGGRTGSSSSTARCARPCRNSSAITAAGSCCWAPAGHTGRSAASSTCKSSRTASRRSPQRMGWPSSI